MHAEALDFITRAAADHGPFARVVEFGGRNINGSPRSFFGPADYTSVDLHVGPGVDVVGDAAEWKPPVLVDCVVCAEVLEHHDQPKRLIDAAHRILRAGGVLILTAATDPREPHSGMDGAALRPGEHYANVKVPSLKRWLKAFGWFEVEIAKTRGDVYAVATK